MLYILVEDYPSKTNKYSMNFVHTRNQYYYEEKLNFKVVSFKCKKSYIFEGISVITEKQFSNELKEFESVNILAHAPNLKNSYRILNKYNNKFKNIILIFHGHEVMDLNKEYPNPFKFNKSSIFKRFSRKLYDKYKFYIIKKYIKKNKQKLELIFVSNWMKKTFENNIMNVSKLKYHIINNPINNVFLKNHYQINSNFIGDFITIRKLDDSKYGIDIVVSIAEKFPEYTFHVYGKGDYFTFNDKPHNLKVYNDFIHQNEIPNILNNYRAALLPTRLDAQGVMACEIATYGMPLITSNLEVCFEMFNEFDNVLLMDNESILLENEDPFKKFLVNNKKLYNRNVNRFSIENNILKEINIIKNLK